MKCLSLCLPAVSLFLLISSASCVKDGTSWKSVIPFYMESAFKTLSGMKVDEIEGKVLNGVSKKCQRDTLELLLHFVNNTKPLDSPPPWILPLLDSWGKPSSGLYNAEWRKQALGDYDQCLSVKRNASSRGGVGGGFTGKYCISIIYDKSEDSLDYTIGRKEGKRVKASSDYSEELETRFPFLFGSCLSSACSKKDVSILTGNVLQALQSNQFGFRTLDCFGTDEDSLDPWDILIICLLVFLVIMTLLTVFCFCNCGQFTRSGTFRNPLLASLSLKTNLSSWIAKDTGELACVNGVLFFTVAWIILSNTWEFPFLSYYFPEIQHLVPEVDYSDWSQLLISNGHVAMDSLFTVCGITVTYNLLKQLDKFGGKGVQYFYVEIMLRLTPIYLLVVGFMATLFRFLADGPLSGLIHHASRNCGSNGWKNILYVNNLVNATMENMCLPDSWYFAIEMQFLLLSPLIIFILWKYSKTGLGLLTVLILGSIAVPGILTYDQNMLPAAIPTRNYQNYFTDFYILPWNRASPFLVGICTGGLLRGTGKRFKLSRALALAAWLLSTAVAISIIFGVFPYYNPKTKIPTVAASIYAGTHRFAWGVAISWIIFACSRGYGGWINAFLSWRFFAPLGRVSMIAFLIALPVQFVHHFRIQPILAPDTYTKVNLFIADLVITYFVAILLNLLLGIPCARIGNLLKPREKDDEEDVIDGLEMQQKVQRFGIYYDKDISVCMGNSKGRRRVRDDGTNGVKYPPRQRHGIYYNQDISISMDRLK